MRPLLIGLFSFFAINLVIADEPFDFAPQPSSVESVETPESKLPMPLPKTKSMADGHNDSQLELIERDIDQLFRRVEELERTKIDAKEAEAIAEKVFKRLSIVVNKADGGQELKTYNVTIGDGSVLKMKLDPGQTVGSFIDPFTGKMLQYGEPTMVAVASQPIPVEQYSFETFTVRQTQPLADGSRTVNVQFGQPGCRVVNGKMVCSQAVQTQQSQPITQPARRGLFGWRR